MSASEQLSCLQNMSRVVDLWERRKKALELVERVLKVWQEYMESGLTNPHDCEPFQLVMIELEQFPAKPAVE